MKMQDILREDPVRAWKRQQKIRKAFDGRSTTEKIFDRTLATLAAVVAAAAVLYLISEFTGWSPDAQTWSVRGL